MSVNDLCVGKEEKKKLESIFRLIVERKWWEWIQRHRWVGQINIWLGTFPFISIIRFCDQHQQNPMPTQFIYFHDSIAKPCPLLILMTNINNTPEKKTSASKASMWCTEPCTDFFFIQIFHFRTSCVWARALSFTSLKCIIKYNWIYLHGTHTHA